MAFGEIDGRCVARRAVLFGGGSAGLALLAGCGGDSSDPRPAPTTAVARANPTPTDDDGMDPFPTSDVPPTDVPPAGALASTAEVPVGGGLLVRDSIIIIQPKPGTFKAFSARCPHQGVTVQPPRTGATIMECPGHNSQFRATDGSLARGPATRGLSGVAVKVQNGFIVGV